MPDANIHGLMIAFRHGYNERSWYTWLEHLDRGHDSTAVPVRVPTWRRNGEHLPDLDLGSPVYFVFDGLVRGVAPLLEEPYFHASGKPHATPVFWLRLDASAWEPCGLEWSWPGFVHSWRYARFTESVRVPFPDWRTHPGTPPRPRDIEAALSPRH